MTAALEQLRDDVTRRWPHAPLDLALLASLGSRAADAPADLYLAAASARAERWALETLEREVFAPVTERLARRHGRAAADEAMQCVREQLLLDGGAALRSFSGQGPLKAWVTVIAVRRLLALRSTSHDSLGSAAENGACAAEQLELELLRARYAGAFKTALQRALGSLERRKRLVLRMHTVDGLSAEKIGAIFHAHRATASQWLADARAELRERVALEVRREAGLESAELQSIARTLQRHTDFSLPRLLAAAPEGAP